MGRNTEPFPADPRRFWFGNRGGDECLICGGQDSFYLLWFRLFFNSSMYLICYLLGSTEQRWGESEINKGLAWSLPDGTSLSSCSIWGAFYLFWSGASGLLPSEASKMCFLESSDKMCIVSPASLKYLSLLWQEKQKPACAELFVVNQRGDVVHTLVSLLLLLIIFTVKDFNKLISIKKKKKVSWPSNQHNRIISEEHVTLKTGMTAAENSALHHSINLILKYIKIENNYFKLQ